MDYEEINGIRRSSPEPEHPTGLGVSITKSACDPEVSAENHPSKRSQDIINLEYDPMDTTLDHWSLAKHLHALVTKLQDHNLPPPSSRTSIVWKNIVVRGTGTGVTYQPSVGQLLRGPTTAVQNSLRHGQRPQKTILCEVEGVVREGEMLLVLGRPGSGCSTLLKSLCGLTDEYAGWEGDVRYNGVDVETFKARFRGDAVYTSEVDIHFPHLKVGDTLDFASETKIPRLRFGGESRKNYVRSRTDLWATSLGLRHILKTKVGNEYVRGISGGERKRVSLCETLATRASVMYWDNPTRGLDASTSLEFIRLLRNLTSITRNTAIVALYQAGENLIQEFDKVMVLYLGRQVFFGTVPSARAYFEDLGFLCKPRQTTADFLTAVTDPHARQLKQGFESRAPRTLDDFVKVWKQSPNFTQLKREMRKYDEEFAQHGAQLEDYRRLSKIPSEPTCPTSEKEQCLHD